MAEFIFVHMIDKQPVASELEQIPLHMTVLHWFESSCQSAEIMEAARLALHGIGRIVTVAKGEDLFGPDRDVPVMRLEKTAGLVALHRRLLTTIEGLGASFDQRWTGVEKWNPHVTHKPRLRLQSGDRITIDDIDLLTRPNSGGIRTILHRFPLQAGTVT